MNVGFRKPVPSMGKYVLPNSKSIRALQAIMDKSQHITHTTNQSTNRTLIQVHKWKSFFIIYQQRIHKFLKLKIQIILYTITSPSGSCMAISVSCPSVQDFADILLQKLLMPVLLQLPIQKNKSQQLQMHIFFILECVIMNN